MKKVPAEMMREFVKSQNFTSTEDIMAAMKDMFKDVLQQVMECELVSKISEKILPEVTAWQNRPLEAVYPFVFMDAIQFPKDNDNRNFTENFYKRNKKHYTVKHFLLIIVKFYGKGLTFCFSDL